MGSGVSGQPSSTPSGDRFMPQPRRITHVALVGGATRMPAVQAFVSRLTGVPLQVRKAC